MADTLAIIFSALAIVERLARWTSTVRYASTCGHPHSAVCRAVYWQGLPVSRRLNACLGTLMVLGISVPTAGSLLLQADEETLNAVILCGLAGYISLLLLSVTMGPHLLLVDSLGIRWGHSFYPWDCIRDCRLEGMRGGGVSLFFIARGQLHTSPTRERIELGPSHDIAGLLEHLITHRGGCGGTLRK